MKITLAPKPEKKPMNEDLELEEPARDTKPHRSYSQLSMYLRCSMQYYFRYILGLKRPPKLAMAIGKGGHSALEANGRHKIATGGDMKVSDLLDFASTRIDYEVGLIEDKVPDEDMSKDRALAALRVYRTRDAEKIRPVGVEIPFTLDLNDEFHAPIPVIVGQIDQLDEYYAIDDFKFTSRAKSQSEVDLSPQLTVYSMALKQLSKYPARKLSLRMFLPGSTRTAPDSREITRAPELMTNEAQERRFARVTEQFRRAERAIQLGVAIPTDNPINCGWCGYRDRCQASLVDDFEAGAIRSTTSNPSGE